MRVLVTGGAGSVGRAVVPELLRRGHTVTVAGRTPGRTVEGARYEVLDCTQFEAVRRLVLEHESVIHLAAIPSPRRHDSREIFEANCLSTYYVFDACVEAGISKIALASSINALGQLFGVRPLPVRYFPIDEDHPQLCTDPYSFSKKILEETAEYFWQRNGISSVSLRITMVVHPGDHMWRRLHDVPNRDPMEQYMVRNYWTWVDARDSARAFVDGIEAPYQGAHPLFINDSVNNIGMPSRQLAAMAYPEVTDFREPLDGTESLVSVRRAKEILGWEPQVHFPQEPPPAPE